MSTLSVVLFEQEPEAERFLGTLKGLQEQHLIQVDDAAIVTRKPNGNPQIRQAHDLVGAGALAFVRLADRPLEHWLLCLLRFWTMPRLLLWRSVRRNPEHLLPVLEDAVETPSPRTC